MKKGIFGFAVAIALLISSDANAQFGCKSSYRPTCGVRFWQPQQVRQSCHAPMHYSCPTVTWTAVPSYSPHSYSVSVPQSFMCSQLTPCPNGVCPASFPVAAPKFTVPAPK